LIQQTESHSLSKELEGKVAVVTGAARNIGRSIALDLSRAGAKVVVNAVSSAEAAAETAALIEKEGGEAIVHLADVTNPTAADALMAAAVAKFGRIDILVNNAAIRKEAAFADIDYAAWRAVTSVILDGAYICAHAALPYLQKSGSATIINIGGMSAHSGAARRAHVIAAKAGLVGLTRALAHDLAADKITVNCVVPGLIDTVRGESAGGTPAHHSSSRTVVGRFGTPEEIAALVRFLTGPGARYITGQTIQANGGAVMC
jgi:3-oxoacyl-[acyl-carrier protein] reductase